MKDTITETYLLTSLSLSLSGSVFWSLGLSLSVAGLSISLVVIAVGLRGFRRPLLAISVGTNETPRCPSTVAEVDCGLLLVFTDKAGTSTLTSILAEFPGVTRS